MRVLVIGANGFIGRNVVAELSKSHEVYEAMRSRSDESSHRVVVDLSSRESIRAALVLVRPDAIINCAGIVANTGDSRDNVAFTTNILDVVVALGKPYPKVVITGSASEYGVIEDVTTPVHEDNPPKPVGDYANSKADEVRVAVVYSEKYGIDVVVARLFNPIGSDMGDKFLLTNLMKQIRAIKKGESNSITLSRLDSRRDYVDVRDVAVAFRLFIEGGGKGHHIVQNVGSGKSTANGELLNMLLDQVELSEKPTIIETRPDPEPTYAARADISRMAAEYNWSPKYNITTTIEDIYGQAARE